MKAFACVIVLAGLLVAGRSADADTSLERVRSCMPEQNDAARLACYDKELGRTTAAGHPADFGMTSQLLHKEQVKAGIKPPPPPPPEALAAKVAKIETHDNGRLVVTLDNGQVWEQQEHAEMLLSVGDSVTVTHGVLGALWLNDSSHRRTRVKRVQ